MVVNKLILHPSNPSDVPVAGQDTVAALRDVGLTSERFQLDSRRHFVPGDNFLSLITFLGCSPAIEIAPPATEALEDAAGAGRFCHILVGNTLPAPQLRTDSKGRARCPACHKTWPPFTKGYQGPASIILACAHCHAQYPASQLSWRRTAGVARLFVEIWGIYPAEAVPVDSLMDRLSSLTNSPWAWFYTTQ